MTMNDPTAVTTGPITPTGGLIAGDDDVVDAWVYGDDPDKVIVQVINGDQLDRGDTGFHFGLYPEQAVALAHRLLQLAKLVPPIPQVRP